MAVFERISKRAPAWLLPLIVACTASTAQAGQYHVYSCRTPAGASAPTDGWSGSVATTSAYDTYALNSCGSGGALVAALGDQTTHQANNDRATWSFATPAFASLAGASLWRAAYLHGTPGEKATYQFWLAGPAVTGVFDECLFSEECHGVGDLTQPQAVSNRVVVPTANRGTSLYLNVSCGAGLPGNECRGGFGDPNNYAAAVYLYAADLTLEQNTGPAATNVSGELATAPVVGGTSDVAFSASDAGSGVYQAVFTVDGHVVQRTVVDRNGGRCADIGGTSDGSPAFLYLQPCLSSVSVDVPFDTSTVANGVHRIQLTVTDPAGNSAPVLDRQVTVSNAPGSAAASTGQPNGSGAGGQASLAASWRGTSSTRLAVPFGRTETVDGRLAGAGGQPIAGAQIDVQISQAYAGAAALALTGPRTAADGTFTMTIPAGASSRTLRLAYRARVGDALPTATRTLQLSVRAGLRVSVAPRSTYVGRRIRFSGRLLGGPVPASGKLLILEARAPRGPWIQFEVVRSDTRGRFRAGYRFKFPGPADYQFRVVSEPESDYPFGAGASNVVSLHEF
jgi:hypothetical protein